MNTEQERAEFEAWHAEKYGVPLFDDARGRFTPTVVQNRFEAYQAGRAALQSQSAPGWKEAFKAWNVCASIHRGWAKGKDAVFTTRQADFVRHAEDAFKKSMGEDGLQSQAQTEPSEWLKQHEALMHRVSKAAMVVGYGGTINGATAEEALENAETALLDHARALQSQDREDAERWRYSLKHGFPQKWEEMIKGNFRHYWTPRPGSQEEFSSAVEAIDHARRIEGGEE